MIEKLKKKRRRNIFILFSPVRCQIQSQSRRFLQPLLYFSHSETISLLRNQNVTPETASVPIKGIPGKIKGETSERLQYNRVDTIPTTNTIPAAIRATLVGTL